MNRWSDSIVAQMNEIPGKWARIKTWPYWWLPNTVVRVLRRRGLIVEVREVNHHIEIWARTDHVLEEASA